MTRLAFCDDDPNIHDQLTALLEKYRTQRKADLECTAFRSPLDLLAAIESGARYDILLLDVLMPAEDGITAAKEIRQYDKTVHIIFLTSSTEFAVESYVVGAYFYLLKPFSHAQLTARVKSLLRRYRVYQGKSEPEEDEWLVRGPLRINRTYNEVEKNGQPIDLPELEYQMLLLMASHAGRIFSAQSLYESVWNEPYLYSSNGTVMVHIRKLRVKLEDDPQNPKLIQTVWGKGYRFG